MNTDDLRLMARLVLDYEPNEIREMLRRAADYIDTTESESQLRLSKIEAYERVITRIEGQRANLAGFRCAELQTLEWVLRMFREAGWEGDTNV